MKWLVIVVGICYSLIRYAWAKGIPVTNWPAFVANKATAFCAVSFLVLGFCERVKSKERSSEFFHMSFVCAIAHAFMSVALLNPQYYKFLFVEVGKFNVFGEMVLFFGALAIALFFTTSKATSSFKRDILVLITVLAHIISVGILKWIDPARWSYGLVPISLLSALIIVLGLCVKIRQFAKE